MLQCAKCKISKEEIFFSKDKNSKSGYSPWCRDCWVTYRKSRREKQTCPHCKTEFYAKGSQEYCSFKCALWGRIPVAGKDDCWEWQGHKKELGYGLFSFLGKTYRVNRAVLIDAGFDVSNLQVCHTCDNPSCCNPNHLFLGTAKDNVDDMHMKGRANTPKGSDSGMSKITEEIALEIKAMLPSMYNKDIASLLGIKKSLVDDISAGRTWGHVK